MALPRRLRLFRAIWLLACAAVASPPSPPARQRSLFPVGATGSVEGWVDDDVAAAAFALFGSESHGLLIVDARELLTSTAHAVGEKLGELHFLLWLSLLTIYVASGCPEDGRANTSLGELARLIWGPAHTHSGTRTRKLLMAFKDLNEVKLTVPGYDMVNQRPAKVLSNTSLLINIAVDDAIWRPFLQSIGEPVKEPEEDARPGESDEEAAVRRARRLGGLRGASLSFRLHPDYVVHLTDVEMRRFDWTAAQQLRGVALKTWMLFTSPRMPYRPILSSGGDLEQVEIPLTVENCAALGVKGGTDKTRRRTLNEAGKRICGADSSFQEFAAHSGGGGQSFLRLVRRRPKDAPARSSGQLALPAD